MGTNDLTALASVVAAAGTVAALVIAVKALRATRRAALADQFLVAVGEMFAALAEISDVADRMDEMNGGLSRSREHLREPFRRFQVANTKIGLLEPALSKRYEYGDWLRGVAHNMAADLFQADEFAGYSQEYVDGDHPLEKPTWILNSEWQVLVQSKSFWGVLMIGLEPPEKRPPGHQSLDRWWAPRILANALDSHNVYSLEASYLTQHCRLLEDFVREYLEGWARSVVVSGLR